MKIYLAGIPPGGAAVEFLSIEEFLGRGKTYRRLVSYYYKTSTEDIMNTAIEYNKKFSRIVEEESE